MKKKLDFNVNVQESKDAINDKFWNRKYRYAVAVLLKLKIDNSNKYLFMNYYLGQGLSYEKSLEAAIWMAAEAKGIDSPEVVKSAVRKALAYETIKSFNAKNEILKLSVVYTLIATVILAFIVKPAEAFVWPAVVIVLVANVLSAKRPPSLLSTKIALAANIAIMIAMIISKFWIVN